MSEKKSVLALGEVPQKEMPSGDKPPQKADPALNIPISLLALCGLCISTHIFMTQWINYPIYNRVIVSFALVPSRFASDALGQFDFGTLITLVTHSFIHGSWMHLVFNLIWLIAFGSPLAYRLGALRTFIFWGLTALSASALHLALYWGDPVPLIGASGAVSGFLGAAARFGFKRPHGARIGFAQQLLPPVWALRQRGVVAFLILWMALNFSTGMGWLGGPTNIAWEAHIGGLVAGFFFIGLIDRQPNAAEAVAAK